MPVTEISRKRIADEVLRIVNAGKTLTEEKVKTQDCLVAVDRARDRVIYNAFLSKRSVGDHSMPFDFLVEKSITPKEKKNYFEAKLPTRAISLLTNNTGIFQVVLENDPTIEVIPATNNHRTLYRNQAAGSVEGQPFYVPFHDTLRIYNIEKNCPILAQYIQASTFFTDTEFYCVPPELIDDIVKIAAQELMPQRQQPEDNITDAKGI